MAFNVDKLVNFCIEEIEKFAKNHQSETFYGFAIDENLLCLNSEEQNKKTLEKYQNKWERLLRHVEKWEDLTEEDLFAAEFLLELEAEYENLNLEDKEACLSVINKDRERERVKGNPYKNSEKIKELMANTGDWAYQGFAVMTNTQGFDEKAYDRHYGMSDERQKTSAYGKTMDELLSKLKESNVFKCLKTADDFYIIRVEHNY
jgi:hypothetical protein